MLLWGTLRLVVTVVKSARCRLSATVSSIFTSWNRYVIIVTWPSRSSTFTIISLWNWSSRIIAGYFVCDAEPSLSSTLGCIVVFFLLHTQLSLPCLRPPPIIIWESHNEGQTAAKFQQPKLWTRSLCQREEGGKKTNREKCIGVDLISQRNWRKATAAKSLSDGFHSPFIYHDLHNATAGSNITIRVTVCHQMLQL